MAEKLISLLTKPSKSKKHDDDFVDRLNNRYTVAIIVTFAGVVGMYSYTGKPITCWCPKHFTGGWIKYTNNYCWVKNTYYLEWDAYIPREGEEKPHILYYQWVPFILLAQAIFFYAPSMVWHALNQKGGIDADNILRAACTLDVTKNRPKRDTIIQIITNLLDRFLNMRGDYAMKKTGVRQALDYVMCKWLGRRLSGYMVLIFLGTKVLYLLNVIMQIFTLSKIFQTEYHVFGPNFMNDVQDPKYFENSPIFPKTSMCDFYVRALGNVQRYSVQCVLPINLYNEKIYAMLWFWFVFVAAMTIASFVMWSIRSMFWVDRHRFIVNHIPAKERSVLSGSGEPLTQEFVRNYLKQDGAFLLRLIAHNTNNITTTDVISSLYYHYKENVHGRRGINDSIGDDDDDDSIEKERV